MNLAYLRSPRINPFIVAAWLILLGGFVSKGQTPFKAGDILTTNLTMQNRFLWTNDNSQVFYPSNTSIRLSDFAGKIAFFVFFDVW